MVVVGADVHKGTHTFVAVDQVGRQLGGQLTVQAITKGHHQALAWARKDLRWAGGGVGAVEDCRHLSARLERDLLTGGQKVVRVPPKMMAMTRASARTRGKSDPIDALAVARAVPAGTRPAGGHPRRGVARVEVVGGSAGSWWRKVPHDQPAVVAGPRVDPARAETGSLDLGEHAASLPTGWPPCPG